MQNERRPAPGYSRAVILENGLVRTMDPSLPVARALAIAGDRVAGGTGTHETALPSPEVVDLGGRCVVPGFTDSHVHFPTWSLAQRDVKLDGVASLAQALRRVGAHPARGSWVRGTGWRSAEWEEQPTKEALDAVTGDRPTALWAKDYHSLWLNSAALALAGGELEVEGGVVERDEHGEPTGVLREESAWLFRARFIPVSEDEWLDATREGVRLASTRGVTAVHDKDGWLGAPRIFQRVAERDGLPLRVWQSVPHERISALEGLGLRSGIGDDFLRVGYLKAFMDGTLGSQTAWMLDGSGVCITSGEELAEVIRAGARAGWPLAVHAIGDRANREALDAFDATRSEWEPLGLRHRIEHAQCLSPEDVGRALERVEGCAVRRVADRVHGDRPAGRRARAHDLLEILARRGRATSAPRTSRAALPRRSAAGPRASGARRRRRPPTGRAPRPVRRSRSRAARPSRGATGTSTCLRAGRARTAGRAPRRRGRA